MFCVNELIHVSWFTGRFQLISRSHLQWKGMQFGGTLFKKMLLKLESNSALYIMTILSLKIHYCLIFLTLGALL